VADALVSFISTLPFAMPRWERRALGRRNPIVDARDDSDDDDMNGDEELDDAVWHAAPRQARAISDSARDGRRLSRDLEEGFRDSTDEETEG
jgi:hypothetical protein